MVAPFDWSRVHDFLNRDAERARLEAWWASDDRMPVNLYGRRRVGKSWLFRRFAHDKPAVLLVAHRLSSGAQLAGFAQRLEPALGVRPDLPDVPTLFRVLYQAARQDKLLVVIDEFPCLLPGNEAGDEAMLSSIQAVMENERDDSALKLVLCGSQIGQMESLMSARSPLHGRLQPLQLRPLPYEHARLFLPSLAPVERFERYAIAGGMPRYLAELGVGTVRSTVTARVLDRDGPLWDEPRTVLEQELRDSRSYFAIVAALATGEKDQGEIVSQSRLSAGNVSKYLQVLAGLRIVRRRVPIGAAPDSRNGRWRLEDPFFRFWFRYVFPYQDELESGLAATDLFDAEVGPTLADHVAPVFEDWCREWTRREYGVLATKVEAWWGPALNEFRRTGARSTEEVDIVGTSQGVVQLVGEVKWRNKKSDANIIQDLQTYKIPALRQAGLKISRDITMLVFAKAGYTPSLRTAEADGAGIRLIDVPAILDS
jgi:AAA+ ATPase superfamily predicted ATPase